MTKAAIATRTLRSPRRRHSPGPAAWERVGAVSGVVGATGVVVAMCIMSSTPSVDSSPADVRDHMGATTQQRPERWLIRFDIEIAAMVVVASVVSFVHHDWLGPGEPVVTGAWFLLGLWVFALARTIVRGDHGQSSEAAP